MEENQDWVDKVWFSDEPHFYLDGYVNSKNNIFWGTAPPQEVLQRPLHSSTIIGSYWFEDEGGKHQENYRNIICKFYSSPYRCRGIAMNQQWFMQDGASLHAANATLELLNQNLATE